MNLNKIFLLMLYIGLALPISSSQAENDGRIHVQVKNTSFSAQHFQIVDDICKTYLPEQCMLYADILSKCRKGEELSIGVCELNQRKYDAAGCLIPGMVFNGRIASGGTVDILICAGAQDYGAILIRSIDNTKSWTRKSWLEEGDVVRHR